MWNANGLATSVESSSTCGLAAEALMYAYVRGNLCDSRWQSPCRGAVPAVASSEAEVSWVLHRLSSCFIGLAWWHFSKFEVSIIHYTKGQQDTR